MALHSLVIPNHSKDEEIEQDNGVVVWKDKWEEKVKGNLGITNTSITLNYYFQGTTAKHR